MYTSSLGLAAFLDWRGGPKTASGIMWFGIGAIIGWPFSGILIAPFVVEELVIAIISGDMFEVVGKFLDGTVRCLIVLVRHSSHVYLQADELAGLANGDRRVFLPSARGRTMASRLLQYLCRQRSRTRHLRNRALPLLSSESSAQLQYLVRPSHLCGAVGVSSVSISTGEYHEANLNADVGLHLTLLHLDGNLHVATAQRRTLHVSSVPLLGIKCCDRTSHHPRLCRLDKSEGAHWQDPCGAQARPDHVCDRLLDQSWIAANRRHGDRLPSTTPDLPSAGGSWSCPSRRRSLLRQGLVPLPLIVLPAKWHARQVHQE
jgi:hypothetical protein